MQDSKKLRGDIQLLRAVAIIAVVAYHAGVPGFSGGFVGVDVFFVISGFLITGKLVDELLSTGRIAWLRFMVARAGRLLPNALLTLLVTLALSAVFLAGFRMRRVAGDVLNAAIFWGNVHFSNGSTDYFAASDLPSVVLQFWSLNVEEQFYFLLPPILLVIALAVKEAWRYRAIVVTLWLIAGWSFISAMIMVRHDQQSAYFLLETRAWELAIGGLLRLHLGGSSPYSPFRATLAWVGVAGMAFSIMWTSDLAYYPDWITLLPVLSAALFISGGASSYLLSEDIPYRLGLAWIGDRSYSLYLWHWPALVLTSFLTPNSAINAAIGITAGSLMAILAFKLVEDPIRKATRAVRMPMGAAAAFVVSISVVAFASSHLVRTVNRAHLNMEANKQVAAARKDLPRSYKDGCHNDEIESPDAKICSYGEGEKSVLLFGDSHAAQWLEPLIKAAVQAGWRVTYATKSACPSVDVTVYREVQKRALDKCDEWRRNVIASLAQYPPTTAILTNFSHYTLFDRTTGHIIPAFDSDQEWRNGLERTTDALHSIGTGVFLLQDNPQTFYGVLDCLASSNLAACSRSKSEAMAGTKKNKDPDIPFIDMTSQICDDDVCPAHRDGMLVYRDRHHLTSTFALTLWKGFFPIFEESTTHHFISRPKRTPNG